MENWIAEAVGKMYIHKVRHQEVAARLGITGEYLSMILNGKRAPKNAEARIMKAIDDLIASK